MIAALAWLPTFREARRSLPLLLEMTADAVAARRWGRNAVAAALRKLGLGPGPAGGLAAGGSDAAHLGLRLVRLETPPIADESRVQRLTWPTAMTSVTVPLLISAGWIAATPLFLLGAGGQGAPGGFTSSTNPPTTYSRRHLQVLTDFLTRTATRRHATSTVS